MSSMRKAATAVAAEDSVRTKMVARRLLVWLPNCSCSSSTQSSGVLPFPAWKREAGVGWREQPRSFCSLPRRTDSKRTCGMALERVKGTSLPLLNPSCPFRPAAMLLWQKDRESAAINAAGRAVPSDGSWRLCHFPGAIPGNYPYLWQENRLLMHQHSCFDTFDE